MQEKQENNDKKLMRTYLLLEVLVELHFNPLLIESVKDCLTLMHILLTMLTNDFPLSSQPIIEQKRKINEVIQVSNRLGICEEPKIEKRLKMKRILINLIFCQFFISIKL